VKKANVEVQKSIALLRLVWRVHR